MRARKILTAVHTHPSRHRFLTVLYAALFMVGFILRFDGLGSGLPWESDMGRDLLVARHMTEFGASVFVSPASGTASGFLRSSPAYFWFVSVAWFFTRSVTGVAVVFTLLGSLGVLFAYRAGSASGNRRFTLMLTALMALGYVPVVSSRAIWQPNTMPFMVLLSAYLLITARTRTRLLPHFGLAAVLLTGAHLYYSFVPAALALGLLHLLIVGFRRDRTGIVTTVLLAAWYAAGAGGSMVLTGTSPRLVAGAAGWILNANTYGSTFAAMVRDILSAGWSMPNIPFAPVLYLLFTAAVGVATLRRKQTEGFIALALMIGTYIAPLLPEPLGYPRIGVAVISTYIAAAYLASAVRLPAFPFLAVVILLTGAAAIPKPGLWQWMPYESEKDAATVTDAIVADYRSVRPQNGCSAPCFSLYASDPSLEPHQYSWYTQHYWFLLELRMGRLVRISPGGGNVLPPPDPETGYLICRLDTDPGADSCRRTAAAYFAVPERDLVAVLPPRTGNRSAVYRFPHPEP